MADSILDTIERISGEKISRTEKEEPLKPKRESGLKKYWRDVKSGKIERVKPWSKKKAKPPEGAPEKPLEEPKSEIKLDKKPPDKEAEEIKKELEEKVSDAEILKKKEETIIVEPKEIKEELGKVDSTWLIYGVVSLAVIFILMQVFKKSSPPTPTVPEASGYREFDIGGGKVIRIPTK